VLPHSPIYQNKNPNLHDLCNDISRQEKLPGAFK